MSAIPKVIVSPLIAVSVTNQADLIKKLIQKRGYEVEYKSIVSVQDIQDDRNKSFLWFTLATLRHIGNAVFPYLYCKKPKAVYVTIEGIPTKANIHCSNIPRLDFIANSDFVKMCLEKADLHVIDVVHHAVDWEKCQRLRKDSEQVRSMWESEFGDRVKLLYVGRNDPRKGLDRLNKALNIVNETMRDELVVLLFTEGSLPDLEGKSNVLRVGTVNSIPYESVLRMIGACDYMLFPSVCEGFGLPVLEANAMGKPAIHAWIPPMSEFSSKDFNFVFGHYEEVLVNQANLQYWLFHNYKPERLAEMIMDAIKIFRSSKGEYDEYCNKAVEHSKNWDYKSIYRKILKHLKL